MRHNLINLPYNLAVNKKVNHVNRQAQKFFVWEKHPRQKSNDFVPTLSSPLLFL